MQDQLGYNTWGKDIFTGDELISQAAGSRDCGSSSSSSSGSSSGGSSGGGGGSSSGISSGGSSDSSSGCGGSGCGSSSGNSSGNSNNYICTVCLWDVVIIFIWFLREQWICSRIGQTSEECFDFGILLTELSSQFQYFFLKNFKHVVFLQIPTWKCDVK